MKKIKKMVLIMILAFIFSGSESIYAEDLEKDVSNKQISVNETEEIVAF